MSLSRRQFMMQSAAAASALATLKLSAMASAMQETGLKDYFNNDFYIGTAIGKARLEESSSEFLGLVAREFSAITMENEMKWERVHPTPEEWQWDLPDKFMAFGEAHDMYIVGHALVWHSQVPDWVFEDEKGVPLSKRALLNRMENHIDILAGRYRGRINSWDVVNESIDEDKGWRSSPWYRIIGAEFMDKAFHFAHDVDAKAQLLYNDYNMYNPGKRKFLVEYIRNAKKRGVPIHGVGLQGHVGLGFPDINEFEASLKAYAAEGMRLHITEFDVDVLPVPREFLSAEVSTNVEYSDELNPYTKGLPAAIEQQLSDRYVEFFKLFIRYRDSIERVSMWGTGDGDSWKNDFPVRGRTNYPLLFDRDYKRKACYHAIAALRKKTL